MIGLLLACAARRPEEGELDPIEALLREGDAAWAERATLGSFDPAVAAWQEAVGRAPGDRRPRGRLARAEWSRGIVVGAGAALQHFEAGRELGTSCLMLTPGAVPRVEAAGWELTVAVMSGAPPLDWDPACLVWTAVNTVETVRERGPGAALELVRMDPVIRRALALAPPELVGFASYAAGLRHTLDPDASVEARDEGFRLLNRAAEAEPEVAWLGVVVAGQRGETPPIVDLHAGGPWQLENLATAARWNEGAAARDR